MCFSMRLIPLFRKSLFLLKCMSFFDEAKLEMVSQVSKRGMNISCVSGHHLDRVLGILFMLDQPNVLC